MTAVEALNSWGAGWASFMARSVVDVSALLAVLLIVWLPFRRRFSAQLGYGLFCLVLLKLFLPVPASWHRAIPVRQVVEGIARWDRTKVAPSASPASFALPTTGDLGASTSVVTPTRPATRGDDRPTSTATFPLQRASLSPAALLMLTWGVLSLTLLVRFFRGVVQTRRLIREAIPLGSEWLPVDIESLRRAAGVRGAVRWAISPRLTSPAVGGLFRPTVVLPPDIDDGLTPKQLTWVLLHELAHIRRGDLWVVAIQRTAQAVFFFHPAVHVANWVIDQLREYACDDAALAACQTSRHDCGEGFLTIVGRSVDGVSTTLPALGLFESRTLVRRRLLRILDKQRVIHGRLSPHAVVGLLTASLLALSFGISRDVWGTPQRVPQGDAVTGTDDEPANFGAGAVWFPAPKEGVAARGAVTAVAYSPDGAFVAAAREDGLVLLRDAATGQVVRRVEGHADTVSCLAFSPDGKTLATGSFDRSVKLWDVASGRAKAVLTGSGNWILAVAFAPDGSMIASAGHDKSVRLWHANTGEPLRTFSGHTASVKALAFAPDSRTLASAGADRFIALWDVRSGQMRGRLEGQNGTVRALAFAPDGRTLASAGEDGEAKLWDVASGRERTALVGHSEMVVCLAFSPRGRLLATGALDGMLKLWDTSNGRERASLAGHTDGVSALAFAPGGREIASGSFDGSVRFWEPAVPQFSPAASLAYPEVAGSVAFSPDGRSLFAAGKAGVARWDTPSGAPADRSHGEGRTVAVGPDGLTYATGGSDGKVRLFDVATGRELAALAGHDGPVSSVTFAPHGRWLVSAGTDGFVRLWDVASRSESGAFRATVGGVASVRVAPDARTLAMVVRESADASLVIWDVAAQSVRGTLRGVSAVAYAPYTEELAVAGVDGTVTIRNVMTLESQRTVPHSTVCSSVAFSPDGRLLAGTFPDGDVALWNAQNGRQLGLLKGHDEPVLDVAFAPDGRTLATAGTDHTVRLWNLASDRQTARATLRGDLGAIWTVAYSPDGRTLVVADGPMDEPGSVTLWDVPTRRIKGTLEGHERGVSTAVFSPDGKTIASGGWDGTIRLWDATTGEPRYELSGLNGVTGLAFSPDGKQLASAGEGRLVTLWDVDTGVEIARLTDFRHDVQSVAFSPDGRLLATGGGVFESGPKARGEVKLWDVARATLVSELSGHERAVVTLAFAPDGRTLATGSADQTVRLWDVGSAQPRLTFGGLSHCIQALAFSRDGRTLAWAGRADGLVMLHDVATGAEVARLVGHRAAARTVAFAPDGSGLATAGADRSVKLWDSPPTP